MADLPDDERELLEEEWDDESDPILADIIRNLDLRGVNQLVIIEQAIDVSKCTFALADGIWVGQAVVKVTAPVIEERRIINLVDLKALARKKGT